MCGNCSILLSFVFIPPLDRADLFGLQPLKQQGGAVVETDKLVIDKAKIRVFEISKEERELFGVLGAGAGLSFLLDQPQPIWGNMDAGSKPLSDLSIFNGLPSLPLYDVLKSISDFVFNYYRIVELTLVDDTRGAIRDLFTEEEVDEFYSGDWTGGYLFREMVCHTYFRPGILTLTPLPVEALGSTRP